MKKHKNRYVRVRVWCTALLLLLHGETNARRTAQELSAFEKCAIVYVKRVVQLVSCSNQRSIPKLL